MPRKTAAQLQRDIDEKLAGRSACAGIDSSGITETPLTDAKRLSAAQFERCYLASVLERAGGSISEGARIAGLDRTNFRRLLQRHGLHSRAVE
jgi:transcriptional regulator with GAF, ATPase, and Fis domain